MIFASSVRLLGALASWRVESKGTLAEPGKGPAQAPHRAPLGGRHSSLTALSDAVAPSFGDLGGGARREPGGGDANGFFGIGGDKAARVHARRGHGAKFGVIGRA